MTPEDNSRAAKVLLIGTTMREKLFGEADPVGATVRIRGVPFTVIGLLDHKGQDVWGDDQDDVALVPADDGAAPVRRHQSCQSAAGAQHFR